MKRITTFSFGYRGWGNATPQLVRAVDAAERARDFRPPILVDCRFSRSVRAAGFLGNAFGELLGANRYRWMKRLGNASIGTQTGPRIRIQDPSAADDLLDLILEANADGRRVLFFCGCELPKREGKIACHRTTVGTLLLRAAWKRRVWIEVVEWPGGKPTRIEFEVSAELFRSIKNGRMTIPVPWSVRLPGLAGLPAGSIATIRSNGEALHRIVGPATWRKESWQLPVLSWFDDPETGLAECRRIAEKRRRDSGHLSRTST
ncbi:MAG: hypothetical protein WED34_04675 [Planctomycetales bacterium]